MDPMPPGAVERAGPDNLPKEPFDIDEAFIRLRQVGADLPKAAMFDLRDRGYSSPFEQLVGAIISTRTRDETTMAVAEVLFARARTPVELLAIPPDALGRILAPATFSEAKVVQLRQLSAILLEENDGVVPRDEAALRALPGVGPKVASLVIGVAFGVPAISVDVHVHRVTHRWGYTSAATPEKTQEELRRKLPEPYWVEINERLVPFGKFVCTGRVPRCSQCALLSLCRQVGVAAHR